MKKVELFKVLLKRLGVFIILPLLLTCSMNITAQPDRPAKERKGVFVEEDISFSISIDQVKDPGLELYRNPTTRADVLDFYISLTGDPKVATAILHHAEDYDISINLAFALAWAESSFNPWAINDNWGTSTDRGLFQLNSKSFPVLTEREFYDPYINAGHGLLYLQSCLDQGGNEIVGLAIYNAGRTRVEQGGTPRSTLDHIHKVLDYKLQLDEKFFRWMDNRPALRITWNRPLLPVY